MKIGLLPFTHCNSKLLNPIRARFSFTGQVFFHVVCRGYGGGGGRGNSITFKFFLLDIDNRDERLYAIKYTFEEYVYREKVEKFVPFCQNMNQQENFNKS